MPTLDAREPVARQRDVGRRRNGDRAHDRDVTAVIEGGVLAGLIGGLLMAAFWAIRAVTEGMDPWGMATLIATPFHGEAALDGGAWIIAVGLAVHLAVSIIWGLLYSILVRRSLDWGVSLFVGLVFGAAVWFVMTFLVLPWANPLLYERVSTEAIPFFVSYLVFGVGVSLSPQIARGFHRRHVPRAAPAF